MSDIQAAENAEVTNHAPDIEARARAQGWRPKEEFKGDPAKWKDAATYVEVSEQFMPVAIERNRRLEELASRSAADAAKLRAELGEVKQVLNDFREFASRGEQRAYERARKELEGRREVAVQHADVEGFKAADAELAELEKTVKPAKPAAEAERATTKVDAPDPVIISWLGENPWFNADPELNKFARHHDTYLMEAKPGMSIADRLAAVKAKTRAEFPEKFENPQREAASVVAAPSGGNGARRAPKHSYENLPPEAKKACDKYVRTIPNYTREEYVKAYAWED